MGDAVFTISATGLVETFNKAAMRMFDYVDSEALINSARSGAYGSLMFLDLDHVKQLNDSPGHDVGDLLLKQVAERIQTCVRECDSLARLGGDKFVILLEGLSREAAEAAAKAETIAGNILKALREPYRLGKHEHSSTPSIGIVLFLDSLEPVETLLKNPMWRCIWPSQPAATPRTFSTPRCRLRPLPTPSWKKSYAKV